ncbi:hypothetical protein O3P69_016387 [Scylla paramamosain]|uniref:C2H2-type domain-containing protein n=1 Tax=Scylla paramamosain TaxID=85552 RepID=A0AAW0TD24_SCYPA
MGVSGRPASPNPPTRTPPLAAPHPRPHPTPATTPASYRQVVAGDGPPTDGLYTPTSRPSSPPSADARKFCSQIFSFYRIAAETADVTPQVRDGYLEIEDENVDVSSWLPLLPLAPDVHAEAATLTYTHHEGEARLRVTLTKEVKAGSTPHLWFSSEVAANLGLPFLNFSHVRGGAYTCPQCERGFPAPNPLKLHLAARCDTLAPALMWARLSCPPARPPHKPWFSPLLLPLAPRTPCPVRPSASPSASPGAGKPASPDSTSCHGHSLGSSSPQEARSAFRRTPDNSLFLHPRLLLGALIPSHSPHTTSHPIMPTMPLAGAARPLLASGSVAAVDPCAEMETLVSNLGRSRRGHLCLYCGKVYSRKYGLKIHIRTHTGYKPLKCRVCLRPFGDPSNLNKHVRLHAQGETPYRCDHCGKVLVRRRDLDRHVRSRHPQAVPPSRPLTDTETETDTEDEEEVVEVEMEGEGLRHGENLQEPSTVTQ